MDYRGFMETIEMSPEEMINYYKKEQAAQTYGWNFFQNEMCGLCWEQRDGTKVMNDKILPLFFFDKGYDRKYEKETGEKIHRIGAFDSCGAQSHIEIPLDGKRPNLTPKLKRTIRHEIIHYTLWLAGLPWADDSAEFWCMCEAYDGGAYEFPFEDETKIEYIRTFKAFYDKHVKRIRKRFAKNLMVGCMVQGIHTTPTDEYEAMCMELLEKVSKL